MGRCTFPNREFTSLPGTEVQLVLGTATGNNGEELTPFDDGDHASGCRFDVYVSVFRSSEIQTLLLIYIFKSRKNTFLLTKHVMKNNRTSTK